MPEIYTHERAARIIIKQASGEAGFDDSYMPSFLLGANGADVLFFHRIWRGGDKYRLPQLGVLAHGQKTNAFLYELVTLAQTPLLRAYAMGFICHYAMDSSMHPYVFALTDTGRQWDIPGGHGHLEMAIDAHYYSQDNNGVLQVPPQAVSPTGLTPREKEAIAELLRQAVLRVYSRDIPQRAYAQSIGDMAWVKRFMYRPGAAKRALLRFAERVIGHPGQLMAHTMAPELPQNDFMNRERLSWAQGRDESVQELFDSGVKQAVAYIDAARQIERGMTQSEFSDILGRRSYASDVPGSGE